MATYEWESVTLGQNPEIQKIVSAASKASELVTTNIGLAKSGLQLAQVFLIGVINPKVILLNAIADEIDNFANDFKNTGFFILEVVPTGMEMLPTTADGEPVQLTLTAQQVNDTWSAAKLVGKEEEWKKWAAAKLGETNWNGSASRGSYKVSQGKIKSDDVADEGVGNSNICAMHPIFNLPMMTPSQVMAQIISAMDDKLDDRRPQFSSSAEVGAIVIIIGFSDLAKTYSDLQTAVSALISFFGGDEGLMTKGFQKTANLIAAPFKVLTDGPSEDDALTVKVVNICQVNGTDDTKDQYFSDGLYNQSGGFEVNDFIVGPKVKFGQRVMGYVSEIVEDSEELDTPYTPYRTQTLKIIGASKLDQISWKSMSGGATIQQAHHFVNTTTFTNQNTGEMQSTNEYNDFKFFAELNQAERTTATTKVKLEAGEPLLQRVAQEDVNVDAQEINAAKCVMGTIFQPKKKKAPPPNFKSAKLEDLIGDFGNFFAGIETISRAIRSMAGDSSTALDEMIEFLNKLIKKLDELNTVLQKILKVFTDGLPKGGVYVLQIPPVVGGNDAIKSAIQSATNRPPDTLDFSIGYVMIGGGPSMKVLNTLLAG